MSSTTILGFADDATLARALASALALPYADIQLHRFPDGESLVRLPQPLAENLIVCRTLDHPNHKLIELLLSARTARELNARSLTLVAPYLSYMRQDIAFHPGEAVSQRIIGAFLADLFDNVITVDPHLHRVANLASAVPAQQAIALSSAQTMGMFLRERGVHALLLGPDSESRQWVSILAESAGLDFAVANKVRRGDRSVQVTLPHQDFRAQDIIIVDDVVSTGETVAQAARLLLAGGANSVRCLATHALFAPGAEATLAQAGISEIWSSDSITHPTNVVSLAPCLAQAVRDALAT